MYKKSYAQALRQLRVNDIMAVSRVSASEVVDSLFDDQFGLSEDDHSDESDEDCIYGYLGAAVTRLLGWLFFRRRGGCGTKLAPRHS